MRTPLRRRLAALAALLLLPAAAGAQTAPSPTFSAVTVGGGTIVGVGTTAGTVAAGNDVRIQAFPTHAALTAAMTAGAIGSGTPTVQQQGYYAAGDGGAAVYDWAPSSTITADGVFVLLPAGQSSATAGRFVLRVPASGVHPEVGGAYCDNPIGATTGHDDTTALNNLSGYIKFSSQAGGIIQQSPKKATGCKIAGLVTLANGVILQGSGMPLTANGGNATAFVPFIMPTASGTLGCYPSSSIRDAVVMKAGLAAKPLTNEDAYTYQTVTIQDGSVGITNSGSDCQIRDVMVIGFQTGMKSTGGARLVVDGLYGDDATVLDVSRSADTSYITRVRGYPFWTFSVDQHQGVYAAAVVAGGASYAVGDVLTVPGGTCATQPSLTPTVVGGAVTGFAVADTGDCTATPQSWGAGSAAIATAGSGGTNGAATLIATGTSCPTQPTFSATIAGGVITAVSVASAGVCTVSQLPPTINVSGGGLSGASLSVVSAKTPIALTGGSGSGATATINVQDSGYRPGTCVNLHDQADGLTTFGVECQEYQIAAVLDNIWNSKLWYIGGEGGQNNVDHQTIGIRTLDCVADTMLYNPNSDVNYIGLDLQHATAANGGACSGGSHHSSNGSASIGIVGGHVGYNQGVTQAAFRMGPGSTGTITNSIIGWAAAAYPAAVQLQAHAGLWTIENSQFDGTAPSLFTQWLSVDPTAVPPRSTQFALPMLGSLLVNGDFVVDQANEGAAATAGLRLDRWRFNNTFGANITSQRQSSGPTGYTTSFKLTSNAASTIPATGDADVYQNVEGSSMASLFWGTGNAVPAVLDFCAAASLTGTYNLSLLTAGQNYSYVVPYTITAANTYQCFSTVIQPPTASAISFGNQPGSASLLVKVDLGSGSNLTAPSANTWLAGQYLNTAGSVELAANNGATLTLAAVHLRPGPFQAPYVPRDYPAELALAQRYYQKSFAAGTAVGQNKGALGATTFQTPVVTGSWGQAVRFSVPMARTPTALTLYSTGAATANCYDATKAADVGAGSAINLGTTGFFLSCSLATGSPAIADQLQAHWTADVGF